MATSTLPTDPLARAQLYVQRLSAVRNPTAAQSAELAKYQQTVSTLTARQAPSPAPAPAAPVVVPDAPVMGPSGIPLTTPPALNNIYNQELATFTQAQTAALAAAGKPAGVDGAERGSLTLAQNLALAQSLNLPLLANQFQNAQAGLPMTVSPQPGGASLQSIYDAAVGRPATQAPQGGNASSLVPAAVTTSPVTSQGSGTTAATSPLDTGASPAPTSGGSAVSGAGGAYDVGTPAPSSGAGGMTTTDLALIAIGAAGLLLTMHKRRGGKA